MMELLARINWYSLLSVAVAVGGLVVALVDGSVLLLVIALVGLAVVLAVLAHSAA